MSANIYYAQVKPNAGVEISVNQPSEFILNMGKAFGDFPCNVSTVDIPVLRGMEAMTDELPNPFRELIKAINSFGTIRVYDEI